jgi:hypothetical protein
LSLAVTSVRFKPVLKPRIDRVEVAQIRYPAGSRPIPRTADYRADAS